MEFLQMWGYELFFYSCLLAQTYRWLKPFSFSTRISTVFPSGFLKNLTTVFKGIKYSLVVLFFWLKADGCS